MTETTSFVVVLPASCQAFLFAGWDEDGSAKRVHVSNHKRAFRFDTHEVAEEAARRLRNLQDPYAFARCDW